MAILIWDLHILFSSPEFFILHSDVKDEILESMNARADAMRKRIVDILGETLGIMVRSFGRKNTNTALSSLLI